MLIGLLLTVGGRGGTPLCRAAGPAADPAGLVAVEGGADFSGHNYTWTVTNRHSASIVHVSFPHFRADLFQAPPGWVTKCTNLVGVGVADPRGECAAESAPPVDGIRPQRSAQFTMRIAAAGAQRRTGTVTVRFADGREAQVAGVELPQSEPKSEQFMPLMGLGVIFAIFVIIVACRRRPRGSGTDTHTGAAS